MTLQITVTTLSCSNKQYNVLIKRVRNMILNLQGLHNFANAQVKSYFPKTEIAFLREM